MAEFSKGEVIAERACAVAYRGRWVPTGSAVTIWEGRRPLPGPVQRSARALLELSRNPSYFPIRHFEAEGDNWVFVADLPDGDAVERQFSALGSEPSFPFTRLSELLIDMAEALSPLHTLGLYSGAIGQGGLSSESSNGSRLRLDLSHAVVPNTTLDWLSASPGSIRLQAQEVLRGLPSPASDLYSIGMLAFTSLGGEPAFAAERGDALIESIVASSSEYRPPPLLVASSRDGGPPGRTLAEQGTQELWDAIAGMLGRSPEERDVDLATLARTARQLKARMEPYAQVMRLVNRGEYVEAISRADAMIATGQSDEVVAQLRRLQYQAHTLGELDPKRAREGYLKAAIAVCERNGWVQQESRIRLDLASFYLRARLPTLARKEAEHAQRLQPDDFTTMASFGEILLEVGDVHGGITVLTKQRQRYPYTVEAAIKLVRALLFVARDPARATDACREALASLPKNRALLLLYAETCMQAARTDEALDVLKQLDPKSEDIEVQNALAQAYVAVGDSSSAMMHLLRSLELQGGQQQVLDQLVDLMGHGARATEADNGQN